MPIFLSDIFQALLIYIPLSIIGLWRWSYWIVRNITARFYKPQYTVWPLGEKKPTVSIVTPVYNEDPTTWQQAMESWIKNGVTEIIAVIDKTNTKLIIDFERRYLPLKTTKCRMIVTPKPGKRAALCDGIEQATSDLIALVDSDTIWDDVVLEKTLPYFLDPSIGGTTVGQRIQNPNTIGNVMFDILLWTRYKEEVPFLLGAGKVINTLSGRTAFYRREALINPEHNNVHQLRHEFFFKTRGVSGDDKRLTHLITEQGWHTSFVLNAWVYTPGLGNLKSFFKQRLRWTRNSWRADLRAVKRGWVFNHPALAIFMIDRFVQPFFMLLGPIACAFAIATGQWLAVAILVTWWIVSRFIRLYGYFKAYPRRLPYLPAYILYGYANAIIKIYALATLLEHNWATRWHSYRLKTKRVSRKLLTMSSGATAVVAIVILGVLFVDSLHEQSGASIDKPKSVVIEEFQDPFTLGSYAPSVPALPASATLPTGVRTYIIQPNDTLNELALQFEMTVQELKKLNGLRDADKISAGQSIQYFVKDAGQQ